MLFSPNFLRKHVKADCWRISQGSTRYQGTVWIPIHPLRKLLSIRLQACLRWKNKIDFRHYLVLIIFAQFKKILSSLSLSLWFIMTIFSSLKVLILRNISAGARNHIIGINFRLPKTKPEKLLSIELCTARFSARADCLASSNRKLSISLNDHTSKLQW